MKKCDIIEIQICEIMGLVGIFTGSRTWKFLKIAVDAGKSLNFGANFIQPRFSSS